MVNLKRLGLSILVLLLVGSIFFANSAFANQFDSRGRIHPNTDSGSRNDNWNGLQVYASADQNMYLGASGHSNAYTTIFGSATKTGVSVAVNEWYLVSPPTWTWVDAGQRYSLSREDPATNTPYWHTSSIQGTYPVEYGYAVAVLPNEYRMHSTHWVEKNGLRWETSFDLITSQC